MNSLRLTWPLLLACTGPALAQAPAAPPVYDSAFAGYRTYREPQAASWKDTNEQLLKRPGKMGHMGHAMSADKAADEPPEKPVEKPADKPAPDDPHAGHDMGGTKQADPHAGHDMNSAKKQPQPAHEHKER